MSTPTQPHAPDHATRLSGAVLGIIVFLIGIVLIGYVFATARTMFDAPAPVIPASAFATPSPDPSPAAAPSGNSGKVVAVTPVAPALPSATVVIGQALAQFLQKLLVLLLMCIAGSVIASKGIDLFFKSLRAAHAPGGTQAGP